jgi:hypothetical protein
MKLLTSIALCTSLLTASCSQEDARQLDCSTALTNWIIDMNITVTSFSCRQDDEQCFCSIYTGNRRVPVGCYKNRCYFE